MGSEATAPLSSTRSTATGTCSSGTGAVSNTAHMQPGSWDADVESVSNIVHMQPGSFAADIGTVSSTAHMQPGSCAADMGTVSSTAHMQPGSCDADVESVSNISLMQPGSCDADMGTVSSIAHMQPGRCCTDLSEWRSLLDLPAPWLVQLLQILDSRSLLALLKTCIACRDLVLRWAPDDSTLVLQPVTWGVASSVRALQLAHQHGGRAAEHLVCLDRQQPRIRQSLSFHRAWCSTELGTHVLAVLTEAHALGITDTVTTLELCGIELEALLPAELSNSLPNLTILTLKQSTINWHAATVHSFTGAPTKLQRLHLDEVIGVGPQAPWQGHFKQQLAQLTALTSLELRQAFGPNETAMQFDGPSVQLYEGLVLELMTIASSQLTRLNLCVDGGGEHDPWKLADLAHHFTALKQLQLEMARIHDDDMPGLLAFARLEWLSVAEFELEQSWAGHHCTWRELFCQHFTTAALARLPLHDNLLLQGRFYDGLYFDCWEYFCLGTPTSMPPADITSRKMSRWRDMWVRESYNWEYRDDDDKFHVPINHRAAVALPLLPSANDLAVDGRGLNIKNLGAYIDARVARQQALYLCVQCASNAPVEDLAELVSRMPAGSQLVLKNLHADEHKLMELCSAIKDSIKLSVDIADLREGYEQRVHAALMQQGHKSVEVTADPIFRGLYGLQGHVKVQCIK